MEGPSSLYLNAKLVANQWAMGIKEAVGQPVSPFRMWPLKWCALNLNWRRNSGHNSQWPNSLICPIRLFMGSPVRAPGDRSPLREDLATATTEEQTSYCIKIEWHFCLAIFPGCGVSNGTTEGFAEVSAVLWSLSN